MGKVEKKKQEALPVVLLVPDGTYMALWLDDWEVIVERDSSNHIPEGITAAFGASFHLSGQIVIGGFIESDQDPVTALKKIMSHQRDEDQG